MRKAILYYFTILTMFVVLHSCIQGAEKNSTAGSYTNISYQDVFREKVKLSSLFDDYEYISLEKNVNDPQQVFGDITKLFVHKDRLIIFDKDITNGIFVYDTSGRFIFSSVQGKGPGEVTNIEDFCINQDDDQILILDHGSKSIKVFSLLQGNLVKTIRLDQYFSAIEYVTNQRVVLKTDIESANKFNNGAKLVYIDLIEPSKTHPCPVYVEDGDYYLNFSSGSNTLMKTDNAVYFIEPRGNDIYMLTKNPDKAPLKRLSINFGKSDLENFSSDIRNRKDLGKYTPVASYLSGTYNAMNKQYLIYNVIKEGNINYLLVSKDFSNVFSCRKIENDLYGLPIWLFAGYSLQGDAYVFLSVEEIQRYLNSGMELDKSLKEKIGNDFNPLNSNPIIIRLRDKVR